MQRPPRLSRAAGLRNRLYEGSYYYIYGLSTADSRVVLARATGQAITNYGSWEFLYPAGWKTGQAQSAPPTQASQLKAVALNASHHFNVEKISLDGKTRFVMVHGGPSWASLDDMIMVRVGKVSGTTPLQEWHDPPPYAWVSDQNTWVGNIGQAYGIDPPCGMAPGGIFAYAQFGQWDLSNQGAGALKLSYYCAFVSHWEEPSGGNVTPADVNFNGNPTAPNCDPFDTFTEQAYFRGYAWPAIYGRIRF